MLLVIIKINSYYNFNEPNGASPHQFVLLNEVDDNHIPCLQNCFSSNQTFSKDSIAVL